MSLRRITSNEHVIRTNDGDGVIREWDAETGQFVSEREAIPGAM